MTQIIKAIPTAGLVSSLGRAGQEQAIFSALTNPDDLMDFFNSVTIMSDDPVIAAISANTNMTVNELIAPFGASEDV